VLITSLSIQDFRSLTLINIEFTKKISILYGHNNAGKTTVLEAIYFCSNLRSFKQLSNVELINTLSTNFKLSLKFSQKSLNNTIYIEKSLKSSKCLYNDEKISKKRLMSLFPCYSLVFGFNNLLLNDSSYRRDFIDSGMFHVEPKGHSTVSSYEKTLRQRNYLLKTRNQKDICFWDNELVNNNQLLSNMRSSYFTKLNKEFVKIISELKKELPEIYEEISSLEMTYLKGWATDNYENELTDNRGKDFNNGYTSIGSHRSDILITSNGRPVKESGSMSTLVMSCLLVFLAKSNVFHVKHGYKPVLLIDDLFFGIDNKNLNTVIKLLIFTKGNIMVSAPNIYKDILEKISINNSEIELINAGEF
jgi:DNA replication and repair protein RecF